MTTKKPAPPAPSVIIDTCVWSEVLRRRHNKKFVVEVTELILSHRAMMLGPIRQEILSGISDESVFRTLRLKLQALQNFHVTGTDYETAAMFSNICRKHGVQGAATDFLICAVAANNGFEIFTTDKDFENYAQFIPVVLFGKNSK